MAGAKKTESAGTSQQEKLQSRAIGAGSSDTTQHEWAVNQHRDSIASYVGQPGLLDYMATAEGVTAERARLNLLNRMREPCGKSPRKRPLGELGLEEKGPGAGENGAN